MKVQLALLLGLVAMPALAQDRTEQEIWHDLLPQGLYTHHGFDAARAQRDREQQTDDIADAVAQRLREEGYRPRCSHTSLRLC